MVTRHGPALLRVANQFSLCHDDALDAYQRALEIYLRRLETVDQATEGAWMRVVVKHEAMAIRCARQDSVAREDVDLDSSAARLRDVAEQVAGGERVDRSVEALRALKPDEAKALLLKAEGLSYQEIGRRFGWTYTKVNRSITEGRKRFLDVFQGIESGAACESHAATLSALAGGHRDERAGGRAAPAPAPLRGLPGDGARAAVLARAADRAVPARARVRAPAGHALARSDVSAVRGVRRRRAARAGGGAGRAVPGRRRGGVRDRAGTLPAAPLIAHVTQHHQPHRTTGRAARERRAPRAAPRTDAGARAHGDGRGGRGRPRRRTPAKVAHAAAVTRPREPQGRREEEAQRVRVRGQGGERARGDRRRRWSRRRRAPGATAPRRRRTRADARPPAPSSASRAAEPSWAYVAHR